MDHYVNIVLLSDAEMPLNILLNSVYTKLHKTLCDLKSSAIGVSFPAYQVTLGNILRLHGKENELQSLQRLDWLGGMSGYCQIAEIKPVPDAVKHRIVRRKQTTMSQAKLKRLIRRGSISEDEVRQYRARMFSKGLDNPYVELVSGSNGQRHRRYIEFGELVDSPAAGIFDQFGGKNNATVPWF